MVGGWGWHQAAPPLATAAGGLQRGPSFHGLPLLLSASPHAPCTWELLQLGPQRRRAHLRGAPLPHQDFLLPLCQVPAPKAPPFLAPFPHAHSPPPKVQGEGDIKPTC